jgi:tetratricopeptide (TPR) repeat protein
MFYNERQIDLLKGSLSLLELTLMKELYKEEVNILENLYKKTSIDFDEYLRFRTLTTTKSLNISNVTSIIPFVDMFSTDPIDYNVNFKLNETNKNLYVFTTKKVKRGDILYLRSGYFSNIKRFILYGETLEKMKDYIEAFNVPVISNMMLDTLDQKDRDKAYKLDVNIDLNKKKFYKKALKVYKKLSILKKEDGSDLSAYKLFLKNLELMRENYNSVTTSDIHKEFFYLKDIYNVKRVLDLEKQFLDNKLKVLRKLINGLSRKTDNKKSEERINKDL